MRLLPHTESAGRSWRSVGWQQTLPHNLPVMAVMSRSIHRFTLTINTRTMLCLTSWNKWCDTVLRQEQARLNTCLTKNLQALQTYNHIIVWPGTDNNLKYSTLKINIDSRTLQFTDTKGEQQKKWLPSIGGSFCWKCAGCNAFNATDTSYVLWIHLHLMPFTQTMNSL